MKITYPTFKSSHVTVWTELKLQIDFSETVFFSNSSLEISIKVQHFGKTLVERNWINWSFEGRERYVENVRLKTTGYILCIEHYICVCQSTTSCFQKVPEINVSQPHQWRKDGNQWDQYLRETRSGRTRFLIHCIIKKLGCYTVDRTSALLVSGVRGSNSWENESTRTSLMNVSWCKCFPYRLLISPEAIASQLFLRFIYVYANPI